MRSGIIILLGLSITIGGCAIGHSIEGATAEKHASYSDQVLSILTSNVNYPPQAMRSGEQGTCRIQIEFDRDGKVLNSSLVQSAGYHDLDKECLAAVGASHFPSIPEDEAVKSPTLVLVEPLAFTLSAP